jgi:hypothetical protein
MPMAKTAAANPSKPSAPRGVFIHPDKMVESGGGLPTGFIGEVVSINYAPYNYPSKSGVSASGGKYSLVAIVDIEPDPGQEENATLNPANLTPDGYVRSYIGAGSLLHFVPSDDGETPKGADFDGYRSLANGEPGSSVEPDELPLFCGEHVVPTPEILTAAGKKGEYPQLSKSSNLNHWMTCAIESGFVVPEDAISIHALVGMYGRWDRVPQRTRENLDAQNKAASTAAGTEGGQTRRKEILVLTEAMAKKAGAGTGAKAKPAAKPVIATPKAAVGAAAAAAEATPDSGEDDFESRLVDLIVGLAKASKTPSPGTIARSKIPGMLVNKLPGEEKTRMIGLVGRTEAGAAWLSAQEHAFIYTPAEMDADGKTIVPGTDLVTAV